MGFKSVIDKDVETKPVIIPLVKGSGDKINDFLDLIHI